MDPDDLPRAFIAQLPIDSLVPLADQSGVITRPLEQIRQRRETLKQQHHDIDVTLQELDTIEAQCQDRLTTLS